MIGLAALLAAAAVLTAPARGAPVARARLINLPVAARDGTARVAEARGGTAFRDRRHRERAAAILLGGCCAVVVGGVAGAVTGLLTAVACDRALARLESRGSRRRRERLAADLPVAADLLAACLLAGSTLVDAADAVAMALPGPMGEELRGVVASIRLGADPSRAWLSLTPKHELAPLGRAIARSADSGSPLADTMVRLADDQRAERQRSAAAAAARVGARAALPLGVCFLPAFVLVGVLPVVGAIAGRVVGAA